MSDFEYGGDELTLFAASENWKAYWSGEIAPFVGDRVLDVGAGIGTTARTLNFKGYERWVGLEPDRKLCESILQARAAGLIPSHVEVRHGTTADLSPSETFDTVLYIDVLEHIEDDAGELRRAAMHLSPGGHIIIVVPAHGYLYTAFDEKIGHFRRYDKKLLSSIVPDGLGVAKMRYLDSAGMIASLANRLLLNSDAPTAAQIGFWDRVLVSTSRLVDPLLRYRVGKSVACVLRKEAA